MKIWNPHRDPEGPTFDFPWHALSFPLRMNFPSPGNQLLLFEPKQKADALFKGLNLSTGKPLPGYEKSFLGDGDVHFAALTPDGQTLVTEFEAPEQAVEIRFWSLGSKQKLRTLKLPARVFEERHVYGPDFQSVV